MGAINGRYNLGCEKYLELYGEQMKYNSGKRLLDISIVNGMVIANCRFNDKKKHSQI